MWMEVELEDLRMRRSYDLTEKQDSTSHECATSDDTVAWHSFDLFLSLFAVSWRQCRHRSDEDQRSYMLRLQSGLLIACLFSDV